MEPGNTEIQSEPIKKTLSRRNVLKVAAAGTATGIVGVGIKKFAFPNSPSSETPGVTQKPTQTATLETKPQSTPQSIDIDSTKTSDQATNPEVTEQSESPHTKITEIATEEIDDAPDDPTATPETPANREQAMHLRRIFRDRMDNSESDKSSNLRLSQQNEKAYPNDQYKLKFFKELTRVCYRVNNENKDLPRQVAMAMNSLSGFSTSSQATIGEQKIAGILNIPEKYLSQFGTKPDEIINMTPIEQLQFVELFLKKRQEEMGRPITDLKTLVAAVIQPSAADAPYNTELFTKGTHRYEHYKRFDRNRDGAITFGEVMNCVIDDAVQRGKGEERSKIFTKGEKAPEFEPVITPETLIQTALDIKEILQEEFDGKLWDRPDLDATVSKGLRKIGYAEKQIDTFVARRAYSVVDHENPDGSVVRATECLGFVADAAAAAYCGSPETTLRFTKEGNVLGNAATVNDTYKDGTPLQIGNATFQAVGTGANFDCQPGDIAVWGTRMGPNPNYGHIGIVCRVPETPGRMFLVESNGYVTATVTDDRTAPDGLGLYKDGFTFLRLKTAN